MSPLQNIAIFRIVTNKHLLIYIYLFMPPLLQNIAIFRIVTNKHLFIYAPLQKNCNP
jgi:hypothetical protein